MSHRLYELGIVLRSEMSEDALNKEIETLTGWIEREDGKIEDSQSWGRRRLAYEIDGEREGFYYFFDVMLPPEAPAEIERNMRIADNIIRYLVVRKEDAQRLSAPKTSEEAE